MNSPIVAIFVLFIYQLLAQVISAELVVSSQPDRKITPKAALTYFVYIFLFQAIFVGVLRFVV